MEGRRTVQGRPMPLATHGSRTPECGWTAHRNGPGGKVQYTVFYAIVPDTARKAAGIAPVQPMPLLTELEVQHGPGRPSYRTGTAYANAHTTGGTTQARKAVVPYR